MVVLVIIKRKKGLFVLIMQNNEIVRRWKLTYNKNRQEIWEVYEKSCPGSQNEKDIGYGRFDENCNPMEVKSIGFFTSDAAVRFVLSEFSRLKKIHKELCIELEGEQSAGGKKDIQESCK